MNANTYMTELAKHLVPACEIGRSICVSKDGHHFGVCVNHTSGTPTNVISAKALKAVKTAMRTFGRYAAAEAIESLHMKSGDSLKVKDGNNMYTVLWITL